MRDITPLVAPRSIAVIGASANPTKSGGVLFDNLVKGKFHGPLYPINRTAPDIMGLKAYATLAEVPEKVDLVYIVLPQQHVEDAVKQCVAAGARAACIITAGFSEASQKGRVDEERLREIARAVRPAAGRAEHDRHGQCRGRHDGQLRQFPALGAGRRVVLHPDRHFHRRAHAQCHDAARSSACRWARASTSATRSTSTSSIFCITSPTIRRPRSSASISRASAIRARSSTRRARCAKRTPIVVLKPGRTKDGIKASASHTGSLASDNDILDGALKQYGIPRAEDEEDFLNALRALVMLPKPRGRRVGIATTSGALGVIATDLVVEGGLELATFAPETIAAMRTILPDWLEPANPFDFWISIDVKGPREAHEVGLTAVFADPNVDLVLCTLLAPGNADFPEFGDLLRRLRRTYDKPVAMVIYGGDAGRRWRTDLEGADIPVFRTTRAGARALSLMVQATL